MADRYDQKRIADPVHGTIGVSKLEAAVINTAAFQRLHHVKQLGLAFMVYPGANYSRFSHCVGVCHVAGRLQRSIVAKRTPDEKDDLNIQRIRLAGLLHDIGHYPYSHTFEVAINDHYSKMRTQGGSTDEDDFEGPPQEKPVSPPAEDSASVGVVPYDHEDVGLALLMHDNELRTAIASSGEFKADDFFELFDENITPKSPLLNLVSSDLDADRIDYMLRTATATGLPYGKIDLNYLISEACMDGKGRVAFTYNALRAIDQFLIGRYFDYRQVSYHKTVAAFEWLLRDVVRALMRIDSSLDFTPEGVDDRIKDLRWAELTDSFISEQIATAVRNKTLKAYALQKAEALLSRRPPRLLIGVERLEERLTGSQGTHNVAVALITSKRERWEKLTQIPRQLTHVWEKKIQLTKAGARGPFDVSEGGEAHDSIKGARKSVRVTRQREGGGTSTQVMELKQSLTSVLARFDLRMIRVFALLSDDELKTRAHGIAKTLADDSPSIDWTYQRGSERAQVHTVDVKAHITEDDINAGEEGEPPSDVI
jgi:HD superfamily phosphohydrolase